MRDGEFLMMAYFKLDKMFCFRYRCVVSSLISAGSVCQPWTIRLQVVKRQQQADPPLDPTLDAAAAVLR